MRKLSELLLDHVMAVVGTAIAIPSGLWGVRYLVGNQGELFELWMSNPNLTVSIALTSAAIGVMFAFVVCGVEGLIEDIKDIRKESREERRRAEPEGDPSHRAQNMTPWCRDALVSICDEGGEVDIFCVRDPDRLRAEAGACIDFYPNKVVLTAYGMKVAEKARRMERRNGAIAPTIEELEKKYAVMEAIMGEHEEH